MFLTATKIAVVESLESVWFGGAGDLQDHDKPIPKRVAVEYPEEEESWPFVLVQVRPTNVEWTGIMPDEVVDAANTEDFRAIDPNEDSDNANPVFKSIRQGSFSATCMLQIFANTSGERDRIWDNLVNLLLMGRKGNPTQNFFTTLENHDLIGITVSEGSVRAIGDAIGMGTPWDKELLTYEAAIEFDMTGVFYADEYNEDLVPLAEASAHEYVPLNEEAPYGETDGRGSWTDPWE